MPAMTAAFAVMRPDQLSDATPQLNVVMRLGSAIGVAVLAVVLQRDSVHAHGAVALGHAFAHTYWWGLGIAVLSLIPCLLLLRAERPQQTAAQAGAEGESAAAGRERDRGRSLRLHGVSGFRTKRNRPGSPRRARGCAR